MKNSYPLTNTPPGDGWPLPQVQLVFHKQPQVLFCRAASWLVSPQPVLRHKGYSSPSAGLCNSLCWSFCSTCHFSRMPTSLWAANLSFSILTASLTLGGRVILFSSCLLLPLIPEESSADLADTWYLEQGKAYSKAVCTVLTGILSLYIALVCTKALKTKSKEN